ncbi:polysaccharide pyruvyl transferase family protein [bacterium]|nr:polysaccharide pyruvyl transferase family protein [candidate division CSSED10-310 bacterium]
MVSTLIGILGSFSGNNAGDSALLDGAMHAILAAATETAPQLDIGFMVPTSQPGFIRREFSRYPVSAFPIKVRYGAAKFWGLPAFWPFLRCDALITTGSLLFDYRLLDPFFNVLIPWSMQIPMAHRLGKPVLGFNIGIGPLVTERGNLLARRIVSHMDRIVLREPEARVLLRQWGLEARAVDGADSALVLPRPTEEELLEVSAALFGSRPECSGRLGINLSSVLDMAAGDQSCLAGEFTATVAAAVDRLLDGTPLQVVCIVTNELDRPFMDAFIRRLRHAGSVVVTPPGFSHRALLAAVAACDTMLAMRLHAVIFAAATDVPVVAVSYSPKVTSFMAGLQQEDWCLSLGRADVARLPHLLGKAWDLRRQRRGLLGPRVEPMRLAAKRAAGLVIEMLLERLDA